MKRHEQLFVRNRELDIIHKVDHLRSMTPSLPVKDMLDRIGHIVVEGIGVLDCFIATHEMHTVPEIQSTTSPFIIEDKDMFGICKSVMNDLARENASDAALSSHTWFDPSRGADVQINLMVQPLKMPGRDGDGANVGFLGVLQCSSTNSGGEATKPASFHSGTGASSGSMLLLRKKSMTGGYEISDKQRALVRALASPIRSALHESVKGHRLREVLSRSVDPKVMEKMLEGSALLQTERRDVTVLFCDLRGSTALAERIEPELFVEFCNDFFAVHTEVIWKHQGQLACA